MSAHAIQLDVTSDDSIAACVSEMEKTYGGQLDVLVNNAGISSREPSLRKKFRQILKANVTGAACLTEA